MGPGILHPGEQRCYDHRWQEERVTINEDGITDHIRAHEDEYFRKKDRELVEMLRKADADAKARAALEEQTGLHDPDMLRELDLLGFTPDTVALLPLVPVLQVAWAKEGISSWNSSSVSTASVSQGRRRWRATSGAAGVYRHGKSSS
jgi:hypothetical protein